MKLIVIDTETTGAEDTDQVVEIATVSINDEGKYETWQSLVKPSVPVSAVARAAHHILDLELADAPTMLDVLRLLPWHGIEEDVVLAGHNIAFDIQMLKQSGMKILPSRCICTLRCAKHLFPDAPKFSNQVLRYHLELQDVPIAKDFPPHRALPDALVTAALLDLMLQSKSVDQLLLLTQTPVLLQTVPVGAKWRGKSWSVVDEGYLTWLINCNDPPFDEDVRHSAKHWLAIKKFEREERIRLRKEIRDATLSKSS